MKIFKDPKKDYFITTPEIDNFSKLHMGMEDDVLMKSIRAGKPIHKNKKAQKELQFALIFGPKIKIEFNNEKVLKPPLFQVQLEYNLSEEEQALYSKAQWYVYSQKHISKLKFEYSYLNNMIIWRADVGCGIKGRKSPQLKKQIIFEYVKS